MKELMINKWESAKQKLIHFIKDERSGKGVLEEGYLGYAALVVGIIVTLIVVQFMDISFNDIGNFFSDGVNGTVDESGLNKWGDQTDGFNQK